jgi:ectoine hydroxylase-related dioxygenase (phytanoyl-CoA dioxygenase family)
MNQLPMGQEPVTTLPRLEAAGRVLDDSPGRLGRLRPTPASSDMDVLRHKLRRDGYLWLQGFLDREAVGEFRGYVVSHLMDTGIVRPGSDPRLGLASGETEARDKVNKRIMEIVRAAAYEGFCAQERLWRFMDEFLGGIAYLHRRKLLRHTLPDTQAVTPAHYDLVYLRGGTDRIVTVWIPIGDIPAQMGGLVYLEGSHAEGVRLEAEFREKSLELSAAERIDAYNKHMSEGGWISKDLPGMADRFNARWLAADYEAGDIMLHSPYMIHASTLNRDPLGRIRLSTDIRYQNVSDEIDIRWANHWSLDDML